MKEISAKPASRNSFAKECVVALLLIFVAWLCGCAKEKPAPPPPPAVEVMKIVPTNTPSSIEFIGQLDSPQNVDVRARVEGFVDKMLFTEGTEVKENDPLFKLDDKPFKERLAAAEGALAEAKASLNKSQKDVARLTPLAAKHAVPQQDLDNATAAEDVSKAGVLTAQARVEAAQIDLGYCDIRAPVRGLIGEASLDWRSGRQRPTNVAGHHFKTRSNLVLLQRQRSGFSAGAKRNRSHRQEG